MSKTKVVSTTDNKIRIIGDNILYVNGVINAYYLLPLSNFRIHSESGVLHSITSLTNLLTNLSTQRPELKFSIQRFSKTIQRKDVINNLYETIKLYMPDYEMPEEFTDNVEENVRDFCLLAVSISETQVNGAEDNNLLETAKQFVVDVSNKLLGTGGVLNEDKIIAIEKNIYSILRSKCMRASKELVFYNYVSKLYPCYDISYDKISYINDSTFTSIMGTVTQTIEDKFGYFIMHNEGVDFFDCTPQDTYGCILHIAQFPLAINAATFPVDSPGTQINIKMLTKERAAIILKRTRAADKYEFGEAIKHGAEEEQLETTSQAIDIATLGLSELEAGNLMCEFNCSILVTGISLEDLRERLQTVISDLKDRDILPQKSLNQAMDFVRGYLKLDYSKYRHFAPLMFPLSFQLTNGSLVGDGDSDFFVPTIGTDLGMS